MMSAGMFLVILGVVILLLMLLIIKVKVHPILALFVVSLAAGAMLGYNTSDTINYITSGFGGTLTGVGVTIILGSILAMAIEETGAAKGIADFFVKLFRGKNVELAPALTAFIVSIPVFGDIAVILTAPIAAFLSKTKRVSMSTMAAFTNLGLCLTHAIVPPTPGILAVAVMLGADLGLTIAWGTVISVLIFFVLWLMLRKWIAREYIEPIQEMAGSAETEEIIRSHDSTMLSFLTILIPVTLIALASFAKMYSSETSWFYRIFTVLGDKVIALAIGAAYGIILGILRKDTVLDYNRKELNDDSTIGKICFNKWVERGLRVALLPLLITAMGGALGTVIKSAPVIEELGNSIVALGIPGILIPWAVAVITMTAVGSMTTAGMTAAAIVLPMMPILGITPIATTIAIGAGTLMVNHVNNSCFWILGQFFNLDTKQSFKYVTLPCALASILGVILVAMGTTMGIF